MKLIAVNSYEDLSRQAADIMESQIRQNRIVFLVWQLLHAIGMLPELVRGINPVVSTLVNIYLQP